MVTLSHCVCVCGLITHSSNSCSLSGKASLPWRRRKQRERRRGVDRGRGMWRMQLRQTESPSLLCLINIRASSFSGARGKSESRVSINTWDWFERIFFFLQTCLTLSWALLPLCPLHAALFVPRAVMWIGDDEGKHTGRSMRDTWRGKEGHQSDLHPVKAHHFVLASGGLVDVCSLLYDIHSAWFLKSTTIYTEYLKL